MRPGIASGILRRMSMQNREPSSDTATTSAPDHNVKTHTPKVDGQDNAGEANASRPKEIGGRDGPDPTRFGDWEKNGRCIDF